MADRVEALVLQMSADIRKLERQLNQARGTTNRQLGQIEKRFDGMSGKIRRSMDSLGPLLAGAGMAIAIRQTVLYADAWNSAANKLSAAGVASAELTRTQGRLVQLALQTRTGLAETVDLYARLTRSTQQLGVSQEQVFRATQTLNQAFKAGGASAEEQRAAITQLSQALASGALQGDELRSIRENAPLLAKAIATEFGVTTGELKKLGAEGKLTTDRIFNGILKAGQEIENQFKGTQSTVGEAIKNLETAATAAIGRLDQAYGLSAIIANAANAVAGALGAGAGEDVQPRTPEALRMRGQRAMADLERLYAQLEVITDTEEMTRALTKAEEDLAGQRKSETLNRFIAMTRELKLLQEYNKALLKGYEETKTGIGAVLRPPWETAQIDNGIAAMREGIAALDREIKAMMDRQTTIIATKPGKFLLPADIVPPPEVEAKLRQFTTSLEDFHSVMSDIRKSEEGAVAKSRAAVQAVLDYANATQDLAAAEALARTEGAGLIDFLDGLLLSNALVKLRDQTDDLAESFQSVFGDILRGVSEDDLIGALPEFVDETAELRQGFREAVREGLREGIRTDDWGQALRNVIADAMIAGWEKSIDRLADLLLQVLGGPANSLGNAISRSLGLAGVGGTAISTASLSGSPLKTSGALVINAPLNVSGSVDAVTLPKLQAAMAENNRQIAARIPGAVNATLADNRAHKRRIG